MESKIQKPIQSNREGEVAEGLSGSPKSVACVKRNMRTSCTCDASQYEHIAPANSQPAPLTFSVITLFLNC